MSADGGDGVRNRQASQANANRERYIADGNDGIRDCHARQATATIERTTCDTFRSINYNDMCPFGHPALILISYQPSVNKTIGLIIKPLRIIKRFSADVSDGIRYRQVPQTTAAIEC